MKYYIITSRSSVKKVCRFCRFSGIVAPFNISSNKHKRREKKAIRGHFHGCAEAVLHQSSIRCNGKNFILLSALSFSLAHRLNPCTGFYLLLSPAIKHFTLIRMTTKL